MSVHRTMHVDYTHKYALRCADLVHQEDPPVNNYEDDPFVYARTAAIAVGVHENTIRNWAKRGWIRAYPLIPGHRFHRYSLDDTRACAAAQTAWRRHR